VFVKFGLLKVSLTALDFAAAGYGDQTRVEYVF